MVKDWGVFRFVGIDRDDEGHNCLVVAERRISAELYGAPLW